MYGKTTDTFRRMKFWLPQSYRFKPKTYAANRESKIVIDATGSFRLDGKFYAVKHSKVFLQNLWNVLTRMCRRKKKKTTISVHLRVGTIKLLPVPNCLILQTSLMDSVLI